MIRFPTCHRRAAADQPSTLFFIVCVEVKHEDEASSRHVVLDNLARYALLLHGIHVDKAHLKNSKVQ